MLENAELDRDESDDRRHALHLSNAFAALVACTVGLIVLGAMVRAHEAGLACPDWPLCFGQFIPEFDLKIGFEYTHRVVAGTVGLAYAALCFLAWRRPFTRRATGRLLLVGAFLLVAQALLGALTVWQLLAAWTVTAHLITGNAYALTLLWITLDLRSLANPFPSSDAHGAPRAAGPAARVWLGAAALLLALQMVLGGFVAARFAGMVCPEWPTCNGGLWFPSFEGNVGLHIFHRLNGYALLGTLFAAAFVCRSEATLRRLSALALLLGCGQVVVGIANVLLAIPVEVTALHSALAAGLVLTLSAAVRSAWARDPSEGLAR